MANDVVCQAVDSMLAGRDPPWLVPPRRTRYHSLLGRALPAVIIVFIYLVIGLLVLCDRYFVPTLQRIRIVGDIPDHVVGPTLYLINPYAQTPACQVQS